jgi:uncharacterized cupin superfamily protein
MRKINLNAVTEYEKKSPRGKYRHFAKDVSVALGREPLSTDLMKRHPFDLAVTRIPPGATRCPYHSHSAQWELYAVISGVGKVRHSDGITDVSTGDVFLFAPNEAHQIINEGKEDFAYCVIADNPIGGSCHYPDSKKWMVAQPTEGTLLKANQMESSQSGYFEGEE